MSEFARYEPRSGSPRTAEQEPAATIRSAEVGDAPALAQIYARREGGGDVDAFERRFEHLATCGEGLLLVAEVEDRLVGYGRVVHHRGSEGCPSGWYLMGLVVSPEHRRRGIGQLLTLERLRWIARRAGQAFYVANAQNLVTLDLHARLGFTEVTREFEFPGIDFQGGRGVLFAVNLTSDRPGARTS